MPISTHNHFYHGLFDEMKDIHISEIKVFKNAQTFYKWHCRDTPSIAKSRNKSWLTKWTVSKWSSQCLSTTMWKFGVRQKLHTNENTIDSRLWSMKRNSIFFSLTNFIFPGSSRKLLSNALSESPLWNLPWTFSRVTSKSSHLDSYSNMSAPLPPKTPSTTTMKYTHLSLLSSTRRRRLMMWSGNLFFTRF